MWDLKPWDNDGAADWYGDLMDSTQLRKAWLKGINDDPSDSPEVVRAAAGLFVMLGRIYIWPIDDYDADLDLAIRQLKKVAENEEYKELPELLEQINAEVIELQSRLKGETPSEPTQEKPWWRFW